MTFRRRVVGHRDLENTVVIDLCECATDEWTAGVRHGIDRIRPAFVGHGLIELRGELLVPATTVHVLRLFDELGRDRDVVDGERLLRRELGLARGIRREADVAIFGQLLVEPTGELEGVVELLVVVPDPAVAHGLEGRDLLAARGVAGLTGRLRGATLRVRGAERVRDRVLGDRRAARVLDAEDGGVDVLLAVDAARGVRVGDVVFAHANTRGDDDGEDHEDDWNAEHRDDATLGLVLHGLILHGMWVRE